MSELLVTDCTVSASWYLPDETSDASPLLLDDIVRRRVSLIVPVLFWYENINVLRSAVRRKRINGQDAHRALYLLKEIPLSTIDPASQGQSGILALALSENLSAYDATYLHCAQSSGALLYTSDSDLLVLRKKYPFIRRPEEYKAAAEENVQSGQP